MIQAFPSADIAAGRRRGEINAFAHGISVAKA